MLTVICPNCHHRFLTPGCCRDASDASSGGRRTEAEEDRKPGCSTMITQGCYEGGFLVPRGYTTGGDFTSGGGCFIKAPTIIQGPVVIQSGVHCGSTVSIAGPEATEYPYDVIQSSAAAAAVAAAAATASCCPQLNLLNDSTSLIVKTQSVEYERSPSIEQQRVATTCDLTGGSVTITTHTPDIQSGGCMIQSTNGGVFVQAPHIEIRPKLTGGGCLVQKRLSTEDEPPIEPRYETTNVLLNANSDARHRMLVDFASPNGYLDNIVTRRQLPVCRGTFDSTSDSEGATTSTKSKMQCRIPNEIGTNDVCGNCSGTVHHHHQQQQQQQQQNLCQSSSKVVTTDDRGSMQIHVNATVQLPANLGECRLNITATTQSSQAETKQPLPDQAATMESTRGNFSSRSGASTQSDEANAAKNRSVLSGRDSAPTTPVSWLMPYPWSLDAEQANRDPNRLREVKELLHMCGWYHEGISWQQSENLLKNAPVGRWLMRDSSDSRYTFAVSVQTTRGPTSIRIHYLVEGFRFDAEPRMAMAMPFFNCPIRMLEHYVEYSKKMDERKEVWVDYSGRMYSQIYLTQPLLKEVRSLSHLARLVVNRHKLPTEHLPLVIRNYIAEYPYTL